MTTLIKTADFIESVCDAIQYISYYHPRDFLKAMKHAYDIEQNTIIIGLEEYPLANKYFQQFLYEYGLKYLDIDDDILSFLHELGHMVTLKSFSQTELKLFRFMKESDENDKDSQKKYYHYWSVPDEFAANIWAINFIH